MFVAMSLCSLFIESTFEDERVSTILNNFYFLILLIFLALSVGFFYHIYTHDKDGFLGSNLRFAIQATGIQGTMDDKLFATLVVTGFMQLSGMLMLPEFFGPSFNLLRPNRYFPLPISRKKSGSVKKPSVVKTSAPTPTGGRGKRNKNKKKNN